MFFGFYTTTDWIGITVFLDFLAKEFKISNLFSSIEWFVSCDDIVFNGPEVSPIHCAIINEFNR